MTISLAPHSPTFYSPFQNPQDYFFPKASSSWSLPTASAYKKKSKPKKEPTKLNISSQESVESPTKLGDTTKTIRDFLLGFGYPYSNINSSIC